MSDQLVKGSRVGCGRKEICASSRNIYACCEVDQCPQNTVNSGINQVCCVPCLRDSGILLTALLYRYTPDSAKDKSLVVEHVDLYVCIPSVHACVYQFAWKSHVTLKRIVFVVVEFVNFMYLFSSLASAFRIRMLQCFDHLPDLYTVIC